MSTLRVIVTLLLIANVISALAVVRARHGNRTEFVELQQLEARRDALEVEWGKLQLEQSAWATHGRIEQVAREELGMEMVRAEDVVVLKNAKR
ncbi:MAG TPA: cell division protein FtsL [Gammaproteobacteria bacterium]